MPPNNGQISFEETMIELEKFTDYYNRLGQESHKEAAYEELESRLLELPAIRSQDQDMTAEDVLEYLDFLAASLQDTPNALRLLNSLEEEEWVNAILAESPLPQPLTEKPVRNDKYVVTVTGVRKCTARQHEVNNLKVAHDKVLGCIFLRDGDQSIPEALQITQDPVALTIDWAEVKSISCEEFAITIKYDGLYTSRPEEKRIHIQFPSIQTTEHFLRDLQESHPTKEMPLWDDFRTPKCFFDIQSLAIDGDILTATDLGEALYLGAHANTVLILGKDGFARPECHRFSFSLREVYRMRFSQVCWGVTLLLEDGRTVSVALKSAMATVEFRFLYGCRIQGVSPWIKDPREEWDKANDNQEEEEDETEEG